MLGREFVYLADEGMMDDYLTDNFDAADRCRMLHDTFLDGVDDDEDDLTDSDDLKMCYPFSR